jgi:hypothetical protein
LGPNVPEAYRDNTAGEAEEHLGETESGKILPPGLIWGRMRFTLRKKSSRARRHATPDPALRTGKKGEFGGKRQQIFAVSGQMTQGDMGII